jgi:predicted RNase H-like nuclease (RuvC/YqgF family)
MDTDTIRLTEIIKEVIKQVTINNTSQCNASPEMVRQHSDHIARQETVNKQILAGIEELKTTNEKQYEKINKLSNDMTEMKTEMKTEKLAAKDHSARNLSIGSVIVAIIAVVVSFFKN